MGLGQAPEIGQEPFVAAREGHHLEVAGHRQQARGRGFQPAAAGSRAYAGAA